MDISAAVLNINRFEPDAFRNAVERIEVGSDNNLTFIFYDGEPISTHWEDRSRKDSWTSEMREAARIAALKQKESLHQDRNGGGNSD